VIAGSTCDCVVFWQDTAYKTYLRFCTDHSTQCSPAHLRSSLARFPLGYSACEGFSTRSLSHRITETQSS